MANEISISASVAVAKGGASVAGSGNKTLDMTGTIMRSEVITIGDVEENIDYGLDIATPGVVFLKNLDATKYVTYGNATGPANPNKLRPGCVALFEPSTATSLYVKAETSASVNIALVVAAA
jgi:hypothetical protein